MLIVMNMRLVPSFYFFLYIDKLYNRVACGVVTVPTLRTNARRPTTVAVVLSCIVALHNFLERQCNSYIHISRSTTPSKHATQLCWKP